MEWLSFLMDVRNYPVNVRGRVPCYRTGEPRMELVYGKFRVPLCGV